MYQKVKLSTEISLKKQNFRHRWRALPARLPETHTMLSFSLFYRWIQFKTSVLCCFLLPFGQNLINFLSSESRGGVGPTHRGSPPPSDPCQSIVSSEYYKFSYCSFGKFKSIDNRHLFIKMLLYYKRNFIGLTNNRIFRWNKDSFRCQ